MRLPSRRARTASRVIVVLVPVVALAIASPVAHATHDARRFELDGNASNGGAAGPDWGSLFDGGGGDAIVSVFVNDGGTAPPDTSYYTGGGSKDTNDVTAWERTTGDVAPDKNEITDAYAVAFRSEVDTGKTDVGDLLFFFGADRFANNGDAQMGFWFFRDRVGLTSTGFTGSHAVGDILVLAHFTQGGRVGTAEVYRWVGSGGSEGSLDLVTTGKECDAGLDDDAVCSIANTSSVAAPWSYTAKSGGSGSFPQGSFYEGGINVSRLVPGVTCFSTYLAETRSSQSVDAQLKDLALGDFDTCPPPPPERTTRRRARAPGAPARPAAAPPPSGPQLANSGPADVAAAGLLGIGFVMVGCALRVAAGTLAFPAGIVLAAVRSRRTARPVGLRRWPPSGTRSSRGSTRS